VLLEEEANHQTRTTLLLDPPVRTDRLTIHLVESWGKVPAALFEVRCYDFELGEFAG